MSKFLNVTNHNLTAAQINEIKTAGFEAVELPEELKTQWSQLNTENWQEVCHKVWEFIMSNNIDTALVAGYAPAMYDIAFNMDRAGLTPVYADTARESVEIILEDGSVRKTAVFKHKGFYSIINGSKWSE